jgi:hypothetical protein
MGRPDFVPDANYVKMTLSELKEVPWPRKPKNLQNC